MSVCMRPSQPDSLNIKDCVENDLVCLCCRGWFWFGNFGKRLKVRFLALVEWPGKWTGRVSLPLTVNLKLDTSRSMTRTGTFRYMIDGT